jgi:hypothetical protein
MRTALVGATVVSLLAGCQKRERPSTPASVEMGVRFTAIDGRVRVKRAETPPDVGNRTIETPSGRAAPDPATEGKAAVEHGGRARVDVVTGRTRVQSNTGRQRDVGPRESVEMGAAGPAELVASTAAPLSPPVALAPNPAGVWSGVLRPPRLAVDTIELKGRQLHVGGRTEPGVTLTVNGVRIPVQGDGSFGEHVVVVDDAAVISVRAGAEGGATTEQRLPVARR